MKVSKEFSSYIFQRLKEGIDWLCRMVKEDGRFNYSYHKQRSHKEIDDYNILRHAGAVYTLLDYGYYFNDLSVIEKGRKALDYLINNHSFMFGESTRFVNEDGFIKTGALGLMLIALNKEQNKLYHKYSKEIANYILFIQNKKTGKLNFYKMKVKEWKVTNFESDFYDGEVALGLLRVSKQLKIKRYYTAAVKLINWKYEQKRNTSFTRDHWMVQAIAELNDITKDQFIFARQSIDRIIEDPYDLYKNEIFGSLGCRIEALLAFIKIIDLMYRERDLTVEQHKYLKQRSTEKLKYFIEQTNKGQIKHGLSMGAWRKNLNSNILRIDFNQHNLSGYLEYLRMEKQNLINF